MDEEETLYETPEAILKHVDTKFAEHFLMKAKEIFDDCTYTGIYFHLSSSVGVSEAYKDTCDRYGYHLLKKYEESLRWFEYDIFMSDVVERSINLVIEADLDIVRRIKGLEGVVDYRLSDTERLQN